MTKRLKIPEDLEGWWRKLESDSEIYTVRLWWRGPLEMKVGALHKERSLFRFHPELVESGDGVDVGSLKDFLNGADRPARSVAMPLVRAGWRYPLIDPKVFRRLIDLREQTSKRFEFIFDTNALVEGIAHWLAAAFADRCDLAVTDVTLRELQDLEDNACFSHSLRDHKTKTISRFVPKRHVFLAATRFREFSGFERLIWRELTLEDTALLVSRGQDGGAKTAESDTAILRAVRRSINDQIQGLERFFVTGDSALARRAATELPQGRVIHASVPELENGVVYGPCQWWPGDEYGLGLYSGTSMRLVWELLAMCDQLRLEPEGDGPAYTFKAFTNPMWPSDYLEPWVEVTEGADGAAGESARVSESGEEDREADDDVGGEDRELEAEERPTLSDRLFPPTSEYDDVPEVTANLRFGVERLLDLLSTVGTSDSDVDAIDSPSGIPELANSTRRYLSRLVDGLDIGRLTDDGARLVLGPSAVYLRRIWMKESVEELFAFLCRFRPFESIVQDPASEHDGISKNATKVCRRLGKRLDQIVEYDGRLYSGAENPKLGRIRGVLLSYLRERRQVNEDGPAGVPVLDVYIDVFLKELGVSPQRASRAFERMRAANVFGDDVELRTGGSSTGDNTLETLKIGPSGYQVLDFDLETLSTYRDMNLRD